jgi:hypothetical protein
MTERTYAVVWQDGESEICPGRLEFVPGGLRLTGRLGDGRRRTHDLPTAAIESVRIGRIRGERLDGHPSLVIERHGGTPLRISSTEGSGMLHELEDTLAAVYAR